MAHWVTDGEPAYVQPPGKATGWTLRVDAGGETTIIGARGRGRAGLFEWLDAARRELESWCIAEHENSLHAAGPVAGCPACAADRADEDGQQVHVVMVGGFDALHAFESEEQAQRFAETVAPLMPAETEPDTGRVVVLDYAAAERTIRAHTPCPECGEAGPCELRPCGDPGCDARDCQRHDDCVPAT